jgi:hypothetical protein
MYIRGDMMNYSTLKEAYSVDTFEREKKPKSKKKHRNETLQETLDEQEEDVNKEFEDTKQMEKPKKVSKKEIIDEKPVKPFYDEELEKYLNVNDFQDTQPYYPQTFSDENDMINFKPIENKPTKPTKLTLNKKIQSDIVQSKNTDYTKDVFYKNLINIGLFILIGIMIIFLCDQITEIAINIGMKKTFQLLEPYLQHRPM